MNFPLAEIKTRLDRLATNLCNSMESGDREEALAPKNLYGGDCHTLEFARRGEVDRKIKSVLRLVAGWAINELPEKILDAVNDEKIKRELKLLQRSLILIDQ